MQSIQLQLATHLPAMCSTDSQYTSRTPPYIVYCSPSVRSFFMKKEVDIFQMKKISYELVDLRVFYSRRLRFNGC